MVVIDYNAQTLAPHMASTLLLGKLTGQEARAQKMADEYKAKIDTITSRAAAGRSASRPESTSSWVTRPGRVQLHPWQVTWGHGPAGGR